MPLPPRFLIVGTPRSGTTLVQRLAAELPSVRVPPETHLFSEFVPELLTRRHLPLSGPVLRLELDRYAARPYMRDVRVDVDDVFERLGGHCSSTIDLFSAVVAHLTDDAPIAGEKTPGHLLWWRPLAERLPELRIVAVVRDPRAVAASFQRLGWGGHPVLTGQRWSYDVRRLLDAVSTLPSRVLLLRYEDVVAHPDEARRRLARLLGITDTSSARSEPDLSTALFAPWETWKIGAVEPIDRRRATAWKEDLPPAAQRAVAAVCRREMVALGYEAPRRLPAIAVATTLPPVLQLRRVRRRGRRRRDDRTVHQLSARLGPPGALTG